MKRYLGDVTFIGALFVAAASLVGTGLAVGGGLVVANRQADADREREDRAELIDAYSELVATAELTENQIEGLDPLLRDFDHATATGASLTLIVDQLRNVENQREEFIRASARVNLIGSDEMRALARELIILNNEGVRIIGQIAHGEVRAADVLASLPQPGENTPQKMLIIQMLELAARELE